MTNKELLQASMHDIAVGAPAVFAAIGNHPDIPEYFTNTEYAVEYLLTNLELHMDLVRHYA